MNQYTSEIDNQKILEKYAAAYIYRKRKEKQEKELDEDKDKYIYVIYARKSTEDDKRQIQSIADQIDHCKEFAKKNNLHYVDIVQEEMSAKTAGKREKFQMILDTIQRRDSYNSILAWHPDRLARNMKESGEIMDMLDKGVIADLKFSSYTFNNDTAGKMTLSILFAMAKEFSDKLSDDTKRGIMKKVKEGKYCGIEKRGYYHNRDDFFRPDKNSFDIYREAWKEYKMGKTQTSIKEMLSQKDIKIGLGQLSTFFTDPFYAGYYCFGNHVVNLKAVDHDFEPMVSPSDFILVQKENRIPQNSWRTSTKFEPFRELALCSECGHYMTAGVSTGKGGRYMSLTCGNHKCKEKRRDNKISPIANTIRGKIIVDYVIDYLRNSFNVTPKLYSSVKEKYIELNNVKIAENKKKSKAFKTSLSKLRERISTTEDKYREETNDLVVKRLSNDLEMMLKQEKELELNIEKTESENKDMEFELAANFPNYDEFLNFFKNAVTVLQSGCDYESMDKLVKLVFLNIIVGDKKVLGYELREPFKSFENLKIQYGVDNRT